MEINTESNYPLVTVFMPCYNHEKFVVDALESVKSQTYDNFEIIICDDCSTDNSVAVIESWIHKNSFKCTFIKNKINMGICYTMNLMLSKANGKYYTGCTSDDIIMPDKLRRQIELFEMLGDEYGVVFSDTYIIDEKSMMTSETFHTKYFGIQSLNENTNYFSELLKGNIIHGLGATFRTNVLREIGGYDESLYAEDWDVNIRLSLNTKIYYDSDYISAKYRILPTSLNNDPNKRNLAVNSTCKSFSKFLGISNDSDSIILNNILVWANELRKNNDNNWKKWYRFLFLKSPNKITFKYLLISIIK